MKTRLSALFYLLVTIFLIIILSAQYGKIPPLGKFLNPFSGFWRVAWLDDYKSLTKVEIPGLQDNVTVLLDKRGVPHIFGSDEQDVFSALGYLHARDRLWQMDIQTRFAEGRVAEIAGRMSLAQDIYQKQLGLFKTADEIVTQLDTTTKAYLSLKAYTSGVNSFIQRLSYRDLPYEFKLLNYSPEPWNIKKTVLLNLMMGYLSRTFDDLYFYHLQKIFSKQELEVLYPLFLSIPYPIIPDKSVKTFSRLKKHLSGIQQNVAAFSDSSAELWSMFKAESYGFGSNNWVVSGDKTVSGYPILANDPHLGLHLPSLWYEAHLVCRQFKVYGVTIPGAPYVVIGFNENIAWGMTNGGWDVTDLYRETFDSDEHNSYLFNEKWQPVKKIKQTINIKGEKDTTIVLEYTHRGPVISRMGKTFSLQWTGYNTNFSGISLYQLNHAKNYHDYQQALKKYHSPAQNIVYADKKGNIAITSAGLNPIRRNGRGRTLVDGSTDQYDWIGATPFNALPRSFNPSQGYLASANQQPHNSINPYFGWNWPSDYRARRINEFLKINDRISISDIKQLQTDVYSLRAEFFVPFILNAFEQKKSHRSDKKTDSVLTCLRQWKYQMQKDQIGPAIFTEFMKRYRKNIWLDSFPESNVRYILPSNYILERLTKFNPNAIWFDDLTTKKVEHRDDIIRKSLIEAIENLENELGSSIEKWTWGCYHQTRIPHLLRLKPLSVAPFPSDGGAATVNVSPGRTSSFGPSWRMIVSLENPIRAWGVYPGGQSGNPASKHYLDFLEHWKNSEYFELLFPESISELPDSLIESRIHFSAKEK